MRIEHLVYSLYYRNMRKKDTSDVLTSVAAALADACAVLGGFIAATWIRFDSGWIPLRHDRPDQLYPTYLAGASLATLLYLFVFRSMQLFVRPQMGSFASKIPRLIKAMTVGILLTVVLAFAFQNEADLSRAAIAVAFFTISFLVLLERYVLFRIEWNLARHSRKTNRVLILGSDSVAAHVGRTLEKEPMFRSQVVGFARTDLSEPARDIPADRILGAVGELNALIESGSIDQVILTNSTLGHERILDVIMLCERNLITFNMVPDLFRIMTSNVDVQSLDDIPLLGIGRWPLDFFWNRVLKRMTDIVGATVGLVVSAPIIAIAAVFIKGSSPGPIFFHQERCGENGKTFSLYKLRTMRVNAEEDTGPVWAKEDDTRRTAVGAFMRRHNLDELPQLWNVLKGEMSLVGPRPERPHFVERFRVDISRYMWRHVSKPGLTGWAQVNGLRGNTSIEERIKYDLYYLENWSPALDVKILLMTFFARENAY